MSLFPSEMEFLKLRQLSLLQSTMELSHIETAQFKCDGQLWNCYGILKIATA